MKEILLAGTIATLLSFFFTPLFIRYLARHGYGQNIRDDGPTTHHVKRGTPTMGGVVRLAPYQWGTSKCLCTLGHRTRARTRLCWSA